jgi:hypothetical protein
MNNTIGTANKPANQLIVRCQFRKILSLLLNRGARPINRDPTKKAKPDERSAAIKLSCHSGVASFKGKKLKIIVFNVEPIINHPRMAIEKDIRDLLRRLRPGSDSLIDPMIS